MTYWFNVIGLSDVELIKKIGELFNMHHMDVEDIVHVSQWSKIEVKEDYIFSILKMIYLENQNIVHEHLGILKKDNIVITFQETPGDVFDEIRDRLVKKKGQIRQRGGDYLFYALLDALIDQYFIIINHISADFKVLEMGIIENENASKEKIYKIRKELVYLVNSIIPIKDSINSLYFQESSFISENMKPYYNDLKEHLLQISDSLKAYKEMTNSLHEMHMSNVSNDMNKIMMTLTIFSAIFIPLSFLAGVFGMNFSYIPGLDYRSSFYIFVMICVITSGGMLMVFKSKKWY